MKSKYLVLVLAVVTMAAFLLAPTGLIAQKSGYQPDKELCAKMIAAGKEYYTRGKYLDAKNFFRKAIEADPQSQKAWRHYDQAVIFALAEKVEKKNDFLVPDASIRSEAGGAVHSPQTITPVAPVQQPAADKEAFKPTEEEGC